MAMALATVLLFSAVALFQPGEGEAALIGANLTELLAGPDDRHAMVDTVVLTWDPQGQGQSFIKIYSEVNVAEFFLVSNSLFTERRKNGTLVAADISITVREVQPPLTLVKDLTAAFVQGEADAFYINITFEECLHVFSPFDLSGFIITKGTLLEVEPSAGNGGNDVQLYIEAGNEETVVAADGADTSALIANNFVEMMLGIDEWLMAGRPAVVPSIPGANRGYFLKAASNKWNETVTVTVVTGTVVTPGSTQSMIIPSINQPATLYVDSNVPCTVTSTAPVNIMLFAASGDSSDQAAPSMSLVVGADLWLGDYNVHSLALLGNQHYLIIVCLTSYIDRIFINPHPLGNNQYIVQEDPNQWTSVVGGQYSFYALSVQPDTWHNVFSPETNNGDGLPFSVYYHITCGSGQYCATTEFFNWNEGTGSPVPTPPTGPTPATTPTTATTSAPTAPTPPTPPSPTPSSSPSTPPTAPTPGSSTSQNPIAPPPAPYPEFTGCPCIQFNGLGLEDPRYSDVDGLYVIQDGVVNGRPYYKHEGCVYFLFYWMGESSYWLIGPVPGENRGILLNPDYSYYPNSVSSNWRIYQLLSSSWRESQRVTTACSCDGVPICPIVAVVDTENTFPGRFHFVDVYNGRPLYKNDVTGLYLYYNIEHSACQRWVIAAERSLISTKAFVYDATPEPVAISSTWKTYDVISGWRIKSNLAVVCA